MSNFVRRPLCVLTVLLTLLPVAASLPQSSPKPLRRAEILALVGGRSLPQSIVNVITVRGLAFHPTDSYRAQLKKAGADSSILASLDQAKVSESNPGPPDKWELELLDRLTSASTDIDQKRYTDAVKELTSALKASVSAPEAGFVMGAILREQENFEAATQGYTEVLREDPNFPDVHTKLSFILYKMEDSDSCMREAKLALGENSLNPEAHKNLALGYLLAGRLDAAVAENQEALRLKPDYGVVHGNLGIVYENKHDVESAISEYKKAVALVPEETNYHYNLGTLLGQTGEYEAAIRELREAKRLDPTRVDVRVNLASFLERRDMRAAVVEFRELEKIAPTFQLCQKCLAAALHAAGEEQEALEHYRKAAQLDPTDFEVALALGGILEQQKKYDEALTEYRRAAFMARAQGAPHVAVGRVLLAKKDPAGALSELKRAAVLSPADPEAHEMLGRALTGSGDNETAVAEFKEAVTLDPKQSQAMVGWAELLEKKGDWANAIERYHEAAAVESASNNEDHHGQPFLSSSVADTAYKSAQMRLEEHIKELKAAGKSQEVAELEKRMQVAKASAGKTTKLREFMHAGDQARYERRFEDSEKAYKQAVDLADKTSGSNEILITALENLGGIYGLRGNFTDGDAALHRALTVIEASYGAGSPRSVHPLKLLVGNSLAANDFAAAQSHALRALELSQKDISENNPTVCDALRMVSTVYIVQHAYDRRGLTW